MADSDTPYETRFHDEADEDPGCGSRRGIDPLTLIAGIVALLASVYVLSDGAGWLPAVDLRWILAGGAVLAGLLMLVASLGRRRE